MTGDALRNTLDALALDPEAGADRHYLVTMLRRLGYSEAEIRHVLGDEGEEGRVIEVEYTGKGASFLFARPGKTQRFTLAQGDDGPAQFTIVNEDEPYDPEAGEETFENVDLEDVDVSDDWGDWDGGDEEIPKDFEAGEEERVVNFKEAALVNFRDHETGWTEVDGPDEWTVDEAPADAWAPAEEAPVEWAEAEDVWEDVEEAYTYGDYTLYTRPVELTTGKTQHIYFFAKDEPKSGEPCALPDGYEVGVSEKTGLPFLRKSEAGKHQCGALTEGHKQCRLTAQEGSDFCHVHADYVAPTEDELRARLDTAPAQNVEDTLPDEQGEGSQQCAAITQAGLQCRNTSRHGSKYCASHKGYHPRSARQDTDTLPVGGSVADTLPTTSDGHPGIGATAPGTRVRVKRVAAEDADAARAALAKEGADVRGVVPIRVEEHDE